MLKFLILALLCLVSIVTFFKPWVGAVFYMVLSVLSPQIIWYWGFDGIRPSYIIAIAICLSFIVNLYKGDISISSWKSKQNLLVLLFWIAIVFSYYFGAFPPNNLDNRNLNSAQLMEDYNKIFFMFFLLQPLITDIKKLSYLIWALVSVFCYYTYWATNQYLTGEMFKYGIRLTGPSTPINIGSSYADENLFAMLFVIAIPFYYFLAQKNQNKFIKFALYLFIPFAWHSIFLTGSRGGLLGLLVISFHCVLRSKKYFVGILFAVALGLAFSYQGGEVMKSRSDTIIKYEDDSSAMARIEAWELASKMFMDHPIFGVGLGNFTIAWGEYKNSSPRVTHSSLFQFLAEGGIFITLAYIGIFIVGLIDLKIIRNEIKKKEYCKYDNTGNILAIINAIEGATIGFFVCGLFLCLGTYEIFYILIMIIVVLRTIINLNIRNISIGSYA